MINLCQSLFLIFHPFSIRASFLTEGHPGPPPQVGVVSAFAQTLRRYTSLNHLAQAARAVLQNTSQINQMLSDLNRVDFANVQVTSPRHLPHQRQAWEPTG